MPNTHKVLPFITPFNAPLYLPTKQEADPVSPDVGILQREIKYDKGRPPTAIFISDEPCGSADQWTNGSDINTDADLEWTDAGYSLCCLRKNGLTIRNASATIVAGMPAGRLICNGHVTSGNSVSVSSGFRMAATGRRTSTNQAITRAGQRLNAAARVYNSNSAIIKNGARVAATGELNAESLKFGVHLVPSNNPGSNQPQIIKAGQHLRPSNNPGSNQPQIIEFGTNVVPNNNPGSSTPEVIKTGQRVVPTHLTNYEFIKMGMKLRGSSRKNLGTMNVGQRVVATAYNLVYSAAELQAGQRLIVDLERQSSSSSSSSSSLSSSSSTSSGSSDSSGGGGGGTSCTDLYMLSLFDTEFFNTPTPLADQYLGFAVTAGNTYSITYNTDSGANRSVNYATPPCNRPTFFSHQTSNISWSYGPVGSDGIVEIYINNFNGAGSFDFTITT